MSMQTVEYQGYGIDLGAFQPLNQTQELLIESLIMNFDALNEALDGLAGCYATPCNTDSFDAIYYLPSINPIKVNGVEPHFYTKDEANEVLTDDLIRMTKAMVDPKVDVDPYGWSSTDYETIRNADLTEDQLMDFKNALTKFVRKQADYSYNNDWTDLV
ncbi:hypothetical protein FOD75_11370 (plasmid) [Limosilactobacillus reuteri]|uniref:Uncharacterized protein n=1 Tax=Limosilactobacillus reuteri TaxID=1598 RepID=A0A517D8J5_LIMRT|nr:hypothetical protein [Limosilactobacillus reuteri]QDR73683.1 hypothetical protein FOD75_11370 [Limosilactobacillus reuteri]